MPYYLLPAEAGKESSYRKMWQLLMELNQPDWIGRFLIPKIRRLRKNQKGEWRETLEPLIPGKVLLDTPDEKGFLSACRKAGKHPVFRLAYDTDISCLKDGDIRLLKELTQNFRDPVGISLRKQNAGEPDGWCGPLARFSGRIQKIDPERRTAWVILSLGGEKDAICFAFLPAPVKEENKEAVWLRNMVSLRKIRHWTQAQLAAMLGTSQTMLARYERGANALPIRFLLSLCEVFQRTPDELLGIKTASPVEWSEELFQRDDRWGQYQDIIREKRRKARMNQAEVAAKVGASQTMYARYERGENEMPLRCLVSLCELYGASAAELLGMTKHP